MRGPSSVSPPKWITRNCPCVNRQRRARLICARSISFGRFLVDRALRRSMFRVTAEAHYRYRATERAIHLSQRDQDHADSDQERTDHELQRKFFPERDGGRERDDDDAQSL